MPLAQMVSRCLHKMILVIVDDSENIRLIDKTCSPISKKPKSVVTGYPLNKKVL